MTWKAQKTKLKIGKWDCIKLKSFFLHRKQSTKWKSGLLDGHIAWEKILASRISNSSKASILQCSAFFTVQLSHPYMTTGKTIALTRRTFVGKVMSLLFNMLSRLVIMFLAKSKCLLISWLQSPSAVILEHKKIKSDTVSTVSPSGVGDGPGDLVCCDSWGHNKSDMTERLNWTYI